MSPLKARQMNETVIIGITFNTTFYYFFAKRKFAQFGGYDLRA